MFSFKTNCHQKSTWNHILSPFYLYNKMQFSVKCDIQWGKSVGLEFIHWEIIGFTPVCLLGNYWLLTMLLKTFNDNTLTVINNALQLAVDLCTLVSPMYCTACFTSRLIFSPFNIHNKMHFRVKCDIHWEKNVVEFIHWKVIGLWSGASYLFCRKIMKTKIFLIHLFIYFGIMCTNE